MNVADQPLSPTKDIATPRVRIAPDVWIPQVGFGVFQIPPEQTQAAVEEALGLGYRHIDTAHIYRNEKGVGDALRSGVVARDEVFVTTKVWNADQGFDATLHAFDRSTELLGVDTVDLYLIHWPAPSRGLFVDTWRALERLRDDGLVRAIGVSNFREEDLDALDEAGLSTPSVNQVELHPALSQARLRAAHERRGITTEAWSPLAQGRVLGEPTILEIARRHDVDPAQVVLAWHLALGNVVFPKSVTRSRMESNLASVGVTLDAADVDAISALDRGERFGPDPATMA